MALGARASRAPKRAWPRAGVWRQDRAVAGRFQLFADPRSLRTTHVAVVAGFGARDARAPRAAGAP